MIAKFIVALAAVTAGSAHMCMSDPPSCMGEKFGDCGPVNVKNNGYCGADIPDMAPQIQLPAGEVYNVKLTGNTGPEGQARHGGGFCEFSLSYDNGSTWRVVGRYGRTCPGGEFDWPVLIPSDAPSGKAIFSWSWMPNQSGAPEFYHECSIVEITGGSGSVDAFNSKYCPMVEGNYGSHPVYKVPGDGSESNGPGQPPVQDQQNRNVEGRVVTCEDGSTFDIEAAIAPGYGLEMVQQNTNGSEGAGAGGSGSYAPSDAPAEEPAAESPAEEPATEAPAAPAPEVPAPETPAPEAPAAEEVPLDLSQLEGAGDLEELPADLEIPDELAGDFEELNAGAPAPPAPDAALSGLVDSEASEPEEEPEEAEIANSVEEVDDVLMASDEEGEEVAMPADAPEEVVEHPVADENVSDMSGGECDSRTQNMICKSSHKGAVFQCNHGKLTAIPLESGCTCQCHDGSDSDGCTAIIAWA